MNSNLGLDESTIVPFYKLIISTCTISPIDCFNGEYDYETCYCSTMLTTTTTGQTTGIISTSSTTSVSPSSINEVKDK